MIQDKIVVRFENGKLLKGYINDFHPEKPIFYISSIDSSPGKPPLEVQVYGLKAIFFVKDFAGNPRRKGIQSFSASKSYSGHKIMVNFKDGETLMGTTTDYDPNRPGFFVLPADKESNNKRCFVYRSATKKISLI